MFSSPLAKDHGPLIVEMPGAPPIEWLAARLSREPRSFYLDSSSHDGRLGRYSFVGCDPFLVFRSNGHLLELLDARGVRRLTGDPLDCLQSLMDQLRVPAPDTFLPFIGGAVGYLGYDVGRLIERLPSLASPDPSGMPEACFNFYDTIVAYDHHLGSAYIVSTGLPAPSGPARACLAEARAEWMLHLLGMARQPQPEPFPERGVGSLRSNFTKDEYLRAVERARRYIIAGDCYQVNLSQRFQTSWQGTSWQLYEALRGANPAPFAAYLNCGESAVLSSSPERFLRLTGDVLETRPIKGTRPRGANSLQDALLAAELEASPKDAAEHIMIVDLERNDLGRVCEPGSVVVEELMRLEPYATVFHLTSTVRGRRRAGRGLADILRATFPGGSITGAPKIRSMQIIEELEPTRRGVYTGAIGYLSASGDIDLNIAIRTMTLTKGSASFQVGGGIVYDSTPEGEYQETLDKGLALARVLGTEWSSASAAHAH